MCVVGLVTGETCMSCSRGRELRLPSGGKAPIYFPPRFSTTQTRRSCERRRLLFASLWGFVCMYACGPLPKRGRSQLSF